VLRLLAQGQVVLPLAAVLLVVVRQLQPPLVLAQPLQVLLVALRLLVQLAPLLDLLVKAP
jgi:hypothetical protein